MNTVFKILITAFVFMVGSMIAGGWVASGYVMGSSAMNPAIKNGDVCLVNRMAGANPRRGEVILFQVPEQESQIIRRVIALEGESVEVRGGDVLINEEKIDEPWLAPPEVDDEFESPEPEFYGPETVPVGHVFVLGDNRGGGLDSRSFGFIHRSAIRGRVWTLFGPLTF